MMTETKPKRNTCYTITAQTPLLRPGLSIQVNTSERYAAEAVDLLMEVVRQVNNKD